jgi:hypothetical protein
LAALQKLINFLEEGGERSILSVSEADSQALSSGIEAVLKRSGSEESGLCIG